MTGAELHAQVERVLATDGVLRAVERTFSEQLFPLGDIDDDLPPAVVEDAPEDRAHVLGLGPGWLSDVPVAAPSGGRRA